MISQPSPFRSLSPRQEALRQRLLGAVARRDGVAVARLSLQWVHRQGVEALDPLVASLAEPEAAGWWRQQLLAGPVAPGAPKATDSVGEGAAVLALAVEPATAAPVPELFVPLASETAQAEPLEAPLSPPAPAPVAAELAFAVPPAAKTDDPVIAERLEAADGSPAGEAAVVAEGRAERGEPPQSSEVLSSASALAAASAEAAPQRQGRLARLRHLVRDCFEEVASTFQGQAEDAEPCEASAFPATGSLSPQLVSSAEAFPPEAEPLLKQPMAAFSVPWEVTEAKEPTQPVPPPGIPVQPQAPAWVAALPPLEAPSALSEPAEAAAAFPATFASTFSSSVPGALEASPPGALNSARLPLTPKSAQRQIRPAPAPAHPALDRLRAWLPDESLDPPQRRAS